MEDLMARQFHHLWNEIDAVYHVAARKLGLSDSALIILYTICSQGEACLLQDITRLSSISKQTVNSALRKLEREGFVYLEPAGRRKKKVCLTEQGKQLAQDTVWKIIATEKAIYRSWTNQEQAFYLALTQRFLTEFREKIQALSR